MLLKKFLGSVQVRIYKRLFTSHYVGKGNPCLGIRRETINAWERRAPLAPAHVKRLTKVKINIIYISIILFFKKKFTFFYF